MPEIKIGSYKIGPLHPPFIVAEIGANHNQSLEYALRLVDAAKAAGAQAIKLQTYTADTMTLNIREGGFTINDERSLWYGKTLYELYQEAHTPWQWHKEIFQRAEKQGLIAFSTPFDATSVDFLESLNIPCYKIASLEIVDLQLIQKVASTGKPIILSTGASTLEEIEDAVNAARKAGCKQLILLKCTSTYPAPPHEINLRTLPNLASRFHSCVGISDHTQGIGTALASIAFGSCLIEKHFTLSRKDDGLDAAFSLEPAELSVLVHESYQAWQALGSIHYGPSPSEETSLALRRSLYFVKEMQAGETITAEHIRAIRPAGGLSPKEYSHILGLKVNSTVKIGDPVSRNVIHCYKRKLT